MVKKEVEHAIQRVYIYTYTYTLSSKKKRKEFSKHSDRSYLKFYTKIRLIHPAIGHTTSHVPKGIAPIIPSIDVENFFA